MTEVNYFAIYSSDNDLACFISNGVVSARTGIEGGADSIESYKYVQNVDSLSKIIMTQF
jgi:hypothetical protein